MFQLAAPLLWPLNLWLPLARHLPGACAALCGALASHAAWLRAAYARGITVWRQRRRGSGGGDGIDEHVRHALLAIPY
ncbi:hypothetical protein BAE44_0009269 [Dichanthelium oligosanthes]|uniref:Uncharacterized protein n=1 Tax=Dichanthelium oligosanthes TaxID=888268 RepID=A0A1E5VX84_9POAL|nr:hypothetical protein BAE44_0009269 [Dichanthelium oligosanthes]